MPTQEQCQEEANNIQWGFDEEKDGTVILTKDGEFWGAFKTREEAEDAMWELDKEIRRGN